MQRFIWHSKRLLLGATLTLFCLASAELARADSKVYQDMLHSSGLVEVPHLEGRTSYGTCWLVDEEQRLALTSQHLVKDAEELIVYFPVYRAGTAIPELAHYQRHVAAIYGRVIRRDPHRDLAVLRLDSLPDHVKSMPLAAQSAGPGDTVHSVGNSGVLAGKLWRYTAGKVRSVYQAEIVTEDGLLKARVVETQSPVNAGDSGGPLVNDRGELVGVVHSTQKRTSLVSFNVDVSEVRAFLAEVRDPAKVPVTAGTPGADRQTPPVKGSWKVMLINLDGDQLPGECRFEADGTFALTAQAAAGLEIRRGRYSYANGVLRMAWDRFQVREALHWVKDRRFTILSDEMLIFDRQIEDRADTESPLPKVAPREPLPRTMEKTDAPDPSTGNQPPAPASPMPSASTMHPAQETRPDWALATILIGAVGVLLLMSIMVRGHRHSTNSTAPDDSGRVQVRAS